MLFLAGEASASGACFLPWMAGGLEILIASGELGNSRSRKHRAINTTREGGKESSPYGAGVTACTEMRLRLRGPKTSMLTDWARAGAV